MKTISFILILSLNYCFAQTTFQKFIGGIGGERGFAIESTHDGGYIISGQTDSYGAGNLDVYLVKINSLGDTLWTRTYGGINDDLGSSVHQTSDGGYIIGGRNNSLFEDSADVFIIRTDSIGNIIWTRNFEGTNMDREYSLVQTSDGGFVIAGATCHVGVGFENILILKMDANGDSLWTRVYGRYLGYEIAKSIQQTFDNGLIITGFSSTIWNFIGAFLIKLDSNGDTLWTKIIGSSVSGIEPNCIQQTLDSGFIIAGSYSTSSGPSTGDGILIKLDSIGNLSWAKTYGDTNYDNLASVAQTIDGGYIAAGYYTLPGVNFNSDFYLIKTNSNGDTTWTKRYGGPDGDWSFSVIQTHDSGYVLTGGIDTPISDEDIYIVKTDANGVSGCYENSTTTLVNTPSIQVSTFGDTIFSGCIQTIRSTVFGSSSPSVMTFCSSSGIFENDSRSDIKIYPNPSSSEILIRIAGYISNAKCIIYNNYGQVAMEEMINSNELILNLDLIPNGIYFIKIIFINHIYEQKLIIQK